MKITSCCRREGDVIAQAFEALDQATGSIRTGELIQISVTQVVVGNLLIEHMIGGDQNLVGDRDGGAFIPAGRALRRENFSRK
jgi:hypothetical protein